MPQLYKVLVDGKSCHSGSLTWSLPKDGQPGEWHEHVGELAFCSAGLHVTDDPARWWKPRCAVFLVEAEGVVGSCDDVEDRKAVARRVRLMREATRDELAALRIYLEGDVKAPTNGVVIASGSATVRAYGSATVRAYGSATVRASGSATVEAYGSATVRAYDSATVRAYGSATVEAYDSATVEAYDSATVRAYGSATVEASGSATVEAYDSATVRAYDSATVRAYGSATVEAYDSATVRAYGSATVRASGSATVVSWWGSPVVKFIEHQRGVHLDRRNDALHIFSAEGEWTPPAAPVTKPNEEK
jgi:hypothetical protein